MKGVSANALCYTFKESEEHTDPEKGIALLCANLVSLCFYY